jgi:hypothetical protein
MENLNENDINQIISLKYPKFSSNTKSRIIDYTLDAIRSLEVFFSSKPVRGGYRSLSLRYKLIYFDYL